MLSNISLGIIGICSGAVVSSGIAGLLISLSLIPRYASITHTPKHLLLYEDMALLGAILGNIFYIFQISLPLGKAFSGITGLFFGIFVGSWILALAEIISVFPIFSRRIRLSGGFSFIIISIALGKMLGCLYFYYRQWG